MNDTSSGYGNRKAPSDSCKLITCILPNDGTEKILLSVLCDEKKILRANSTSCMGIAILAGVTTKVDELPEPTMVWKVDVLVAEKDANDLYEYIYEQARIGRHRGGVIWMSALTLSSPFSLPEGLPAEKP